MEWSSEGEIGRPVASMGRFPDLRRRNWYEMGDTDGSRNMTLLGADAPAAMASTA